MKLSFKQKMDSSWFIVVIILLFECLYSQSGQDSESTYRLLFDAIQNSHDLSFPAWGPYTKKYIGLSHIPEPEKGIRFDLSVFPGFYRRKVDVPNAFFESGYHPWEASPDLNYFSFRHELEWKDQVYTDISYSRIDDQSRLIRMQCVNQSSNEQSIVLHLMASIHFPSLKTSSPDTCIYPAEIISSHKVDWIRGIDYVHIISQDQEPQKTLVYDGLWYKEIRDHGFVSGSGLGRRFGRHKNDQVSYRFTLEQQLVDAVLLFRYRMKKSDRLTFTMSGSFHGELNCLGADTLTTLTVPLGLVERGQQILTLTSYGGPAIEIDGFCIVAKTEAERIRFKNIQWQPIPELLKGPIANSLIIKYKDVDSYYGLIWFSDDYQVREFFCRDLDVYFRRKANEHVLTKFYGEGEGHYTNVFLRPIRLHPRSQKTLSSVICNGSREKVTEYLSSYQKQTENLAAIYQSNRKAIVNFQTKTDGNQYSFSQARMAATLLCNVIYPVYTQKSFIRHSTPGRWWDSLYTWDSGFIGLGLLELDTRRAIESLNAYTTPPGSQSAFIHHGSPVPVQMSLFLELWNRTQSLELLRYFYPRMKQYYLFLSGQRGSSTTRTLKSNLTKTWDYFYNSGGWDDYPPQKYVHAQYLEATVAPMISTSHCIRSAKILKMAAQELNLMDDVRHYEQDIRLFSEAIQKYGWDAEAGYFGYVQHDEKGKPIGLLRTSDGENFNKGLDGCYPLFAGIGTQEQNKRLLQHLQTDGQLWSWIGLSAVDQTAGYYLKDGYWNGTVWMAHQWFFWKRMLDLGEEAFAHRIAMTALDVWKKEVETSYNCMEHFIIETGRGAGWHEFGGLSAPVLSWFASYYRPGHVSTGYEIWIQSQSFNNDQSELDLELTHHSEDSIKGSTILICMNPAYEYQATYNGAKVAVKTYDKGSIAVQIPNTPSVGRLKVLKRIKCL